MGKKIKKVTGVARYIPARVATESNSSGLGTQTRNVSPPLQKPSIYEVLRDFEAIRKLDRMQENRRKRSELRGEILPHLPKGMERLANCGTKPIWGREVEIYQGADKKAFFAGVESCGNVWACPICSAKIQYRRGLEIKKAVDKAYKQGYRVTMITFTHPHHRGDSLSGLIARQNKALRYFRMGKWSDNWKKAIGYFGTITAAEVTKGDNGWHWHHHVLYISKSDNWDENALKARWINCLKRAGFNSDKNRMDIYTHGLNVMKNCHASDYLAKMGLKSWGIENELQAGHRKEAGRGGVTPFQLAEDGRWDEWNEYVLATRGRKQLVWSKGLKNWACIEELTDEEIATSEEQEQVKRVAVVPILVWWQLVRQGLRLELLETLENKGVDGLKAWCLQKGVDIYFPRPPVPKWADFGGQAVYEVIA